VGPGPARVRLKVLLDWRTRPLYNVIARIEGAECPDQWIVRGNHHDAWVHGAMDPGSGHVTLQETARALGQLLKEGWRPRRTIVLASWDGEEWGLIGSSEWGEKHAAELTDKAVAYLNTDLTGRAWLAAGGSHSLQELVSEVARDVPQPDGTGSVYEAARGRLVELGAIEAGRAPAAGFSTLPLYGLGAETDYAVFIGHLGVASLDLLFDGAWHWRGVYHSTYDSFDWYTRFGDPTFEYGKALTEVSGTILMRLADATVLPFGFHDLATAIRGYLGEIEQTRQRASADQLWSWTLLEEALQQLDRAASAWEEALSEVSQLPASSIRRQRDGLAAVDRSIYGTERLFRHEAGLPGRPWFRHLLYASDPYQGRVASTLPAIREGVERGEWEQARQFVRVVANAVIAVAVQVEQAAASLTALFTESIPS
jgi:N-acetylated-alpha-linked acidic dipeptidase